MPHSVFSSVDCPALPNFSTLSHKRHDFRGGGGFYEHKLFRFSLQIRPETFLILRRIERDVIINVHTSSCKITVIIVRF